MEVSHIPKKGVEQSVGWPTLRDSKWFRSLDAGFAAGIIAHGVVRHLKHGEVLFARGDPPAGLYGMLEGELRVSGVAENGKEALLTLAEPPTWFGEISVIDGQPRTHTAIAEGPASLIHVPGQLIERLMEEDPRRWRDMSMLVAGKLRMAFVALEDTALSPLSVRLARRLLWMVQGYGEREGHTRRTVEVKQEQLALMLATSRQTVNQLLKETEAQGWLKVSYGEIEILDLAALQRAANV